MKEGMSNEREQALDAALTTSILLMPEYYDDFATAIKNGNRQQFDAVCERARINDLTLRGAIYDAARAALDKYKLPW
jgi:hypothetical protein